jgi:hypothetical protein
MRSGMPAWTSPKTTFHTFDPQSGEIQKSANGRWEVFRRFLNKDSADYNGRSYQRTGKSERTIPRRDPGWVLELIPRARNGRLTGFRRGVSIVDPGSVESVSALKSPWVEWGWIDSHEWSGPLSIQHPPFGWILPPSG